MERKDYHVQNRKIEMQMLKAYEDYLKNNEKSKATCEKYVRDIKHFVEFAGGHDIDKALLLDYKAILEEEYAITSANSMIAAVNSFLRYVGWNELCIKQFKIQKTVYCPEEKELSVAEFHSLIKTAEKNNKERLALVLQTICGTGIRVSELQYMTVETVRKGEATVSCKGKTRKIFIVNKLQKKLLAYAQKSNIESGMIFTTKSGKPWDRNNIWREMKKLCELAGIDTQKVFPHNLRHLFARSFYSIEKDIAKLADILGHSNINTTRIYIMTTFAEHKRKMESMRLII